MTDDLERLIADARRGDRDALEGLIHRHLPGLRAFVRLQAGPELRMRESCSDVVQSVCREVLEHIDEFRYRGPDSFRNWLFRAARNKLVDHRRYHHAQRRDARREVELEGDAALLDCYSMLATPSGHAIAHEEVARIEAAFDRLPDDQRRVVVLSKVAGLSHRDIAAELGRTPLAVRSLLCRALTRLSEFLAEQRE